MFHSLRFTGKLLPRLNATRVNSYSTTSTPLTLKPISRSSAPSLPSPTLPPPTNYTVTSLKKSPLPLTSSTTIILTPTPSSTLTPSQSNIIPEAIELTLPNLFLRDSSFHPDHLHEFNKQKLFKSSDLLQVPSSTSTTSTTDEEPTIKGYGVHTINSAENLIIEWTQSLNSTPLTIHPLPFLLNISRNSNLSNDEFHLPPLHHWSNSTLLPTLLTTPYSSYISSPSSLHSTLSSLLSNGITFLSSVPTSSKSGQETTLRQVVERIGSIRRTWYGDLWDVRNEGIKESKNIAFTDLDLGVHMDLVHFTSPPRYQFLHSLLNKNISGGLSYFVDSYYIANLIKESNPELFKILCEEEVLFEYTSEEHHTRFSRSTIELGKGGEIIAVNYSPPFQGPLPLSQLSPSSAPTKATEEKLQLLVKALKLFSDLSDLTENQFSIQLQPGDCVIFDNRRVLHARTKFEFVKPVEGAEGGEVEGSGRWLKGAYMDEDEVRSKWRILESKRRKVGLE